MTTKKHETDVAFIEALAKLLRENDLTELEVEREYGEDDSLSVRVSRGGPVMAAPVVAAPAPVAAKEITKKAPAVAAPAKSQKSEPRQLRGR